MEPKHIEIHFISDRLDSDAVKVVQRLKKFGHEAYFVGGCVRDLLVDLSPKDFDIATSALPQEIRRIFRNSRIIGRRFRLIHVYFPNRKIIEVATFRAAAVVELPNTLELEPQAENAEATAEAPPDLLIRDDNVFGNAESDALRRDFTINALFYDVTTGEVIDYVHGVSDLRKQMVVSIGDPQKRLREDPVRIIRAAKFAARLKLTIEPHLLQAMRDCAPEIAKASPARVVEEIFKILAGRGLHPCLDLLNELGVLQVTLPSLALVLRRDHRAASEDHFWRIFEALEYGISGQIPAVASGEIPMSLPEPPKNISDPGRAVLFAVLVFPIIQEDFWQLFTEQGRNLHHLRLRLRRRIQDFAVTIRNPRKTTWEAQQMFSAQERLFRGVTEHDRGHRRRRRRRSSAGEFVTRPLIPEALQLMWLIGVATKNFPYWEAYLAWQSFHANASHHGPSASQGYPPQMPRRRRRRRGRRRRKPMGNSEPSSPEQDGP